MELINDEYLEELHYSKRKKLVKVFNDRTNKIVTHSCDIHMKYYACAGICQFTIFDNCEYSSSIISLHPCDLTRALELKNTIFDSSPDIITIEWMNYHGFSHWGAF